ncbi:dynamin central region [Colletotrichum paranaense]|uniref:dynamin GTPase n=5 Tax=Colletotrichum acutatum species complex TaxID=2707335 RepID=A0A9Q0BAG4_9PEZI|nr:dynamin central region [Colletotrichum paranaense]XP_060384683.1 dynamin central region [Colletotrichum tamarilloi]XP_060405774.1 dynamin central region [Colletotrichum abscissum]KAI3551514.1 dynamin central region [Colletotrichum filicis]KAK0374694.1 dynamin central region [Colletotrichum limetticola]KAK1451587.1 dynamin central region [Colletotrichum melonis]KAK1714740.1 Dynamin central region-domain-containing protein [Colletotrichum lupini]KAI3558722.1 dynamin central region [Colletot
MASLGDDLLGTVNKLQDLVFNTIGSDSLDLPQIVVVGSQSAGKSSVLENIVGRDFLPRGSGICTRRPLILQLINVSEDESALDPSSDPYRSPDLARRSEWAEFHHIPNRRFNDFSDVKREIENETARVAGNNKGINRQPINLKIYSPHVLNLTLVDLPGLTKVPIGDQPTDIEKQTRNLISEYIAKPNSIVLAVSPANVDIVNSEALKLARHVDPLGRRTIGVLTKVDLMDHGTNALDILSGRVYPLKLGFIGVVNRSQQDIQGAKPMEEALKAESEFFRHHPAYRNIASRCGTQYLAKTLNTTLMAHIRERMPDIKARLNTLMGQTQQELASYGDMHFSGKEHRGSLILQQMTRFATSFISSIDGTSTEISTKELCGGARIYYIFNSVFGMSLESIDPTSNLSALDIRTAIRNSTGPRPSLFVPEMAFDLLVKPQIKLLEIPSQRCVELVYEELIKICHTCGSTELSRYPRLQAKLIEVVSDLLRERLGPTSGYVESLISIQRAYINTNHPNFLGAAAAMSHVVSNKQERERKRLIQEERERREKRRLKELGANGTEGPEGEEEEPAVIEKAESNSLRKQATKGARSLSPGVRENGTTGLNAALNGARSASPSRFNDKGLGGARDSFLTYFFGKDGASAIGAASSPNSSIARHVSQSSEPTFSQSIRRAEDKVALRAPAQASSRDELEFGKPQQSIDYGSLFGTASGEPAMTEREAMETELIRALISSYFNIVRESIADQVPKAVMHLLVNHCKDVVQNRLVSELYKEALFEELLYEDDGVKKEREKCEKLLQTYREAAKIIGEVL